MLAQNPNTPPAQPSQFDFFFIKALLVIVSRSNRFYRKRTELVKMTLSHKVQCIVTAYVGASSLTKITHKFRVYATYKFLPAVVSFWRIRELTGFCMQMSFTYKNFM